MATIHRCDVCGVEVRNRHELWEVSFAPAEKVPGFPDKRRFERIECCGKCKKRAYAAMMEVGR